RPSGAFHPLCAAARSRSSRRGIYHACARSSWVDSRVMRAGDRRWTAWLQMTVLVPANLIGAIVSFTYFNFVDRLAPGPDEVLAGSILVFLFGFGLLSGLVSVWANRWSRVLDPVDGRLPTSTEARRRALLLPYALAGIVFVAWALAGLLFGVIRPLTLGAFTT